MIRTLQKTKRNPRLSDRLQLLALSESQSSGQFVKNSFRCTRLSILWKHGRKYFRRFRTVTLLMRLTPWILLAISTNTSRYLLIAFSAFLLFFAIFFLFAFPGFTPPKSDRLMKEALLGKTVYVLFLHRSGEFSHGRFWRQNARSLAALPNSAVILVSPFLISPRGLSRVSFYRSFRREEHNIFTVRQRYFFLLKKTTLSECAKRSILIY